MAISYYKHSNAWSKCQPYYNKTKLQIIASNFLKKKNVGPNLIQLELFKIGSSLKRANIIIINLLSTTIKSNTYNTNMNFYKSDTWMLRIVS